MYKLSILLIFIVCILSCHDDDMPPPDVLDWPDLPERPEVVTGDYVITPEDIPGKETGFILYNIHQPDSILFALTFFGIGPYTEYFRISKIPFASDVYDLHYYHSDDSIPGAALLIQEFDYTIDRYHVVEGNPGRLDLFVSDTVISGEFQMDLILSEASYDVDYYPDSISIDGWFKVELQP